MSQAKEILEGAQIIKEFMQPLWGEDNIGTMSVISDGLGSEHEGKTFDTDESLAAFLRSQYSNEDNNLSDDFIIQEAQMNGYFEAVEYITYSSDWNLLIPALKKATSLANEFLSVNDFDSYKFQFKMVYSPLQYSIENVCIQLGQFIKWYEENKLED